MALWNLTLRRPIDSLGLEKEHWVRIAKGREEQTLRVVRVGRADDLEARGVDEKGLRRLRVVEAAPYPTAHGGPDDDLRRVLTS
jgi:hypothetical protein